MEFPTSTPEIDDEILKTPEDWIEELCPGIEIMDPDGWRSDKLPLNALIAREDFLKRFAMSTVRGSQDDMIKMRDLLIEELD